jgi:hypothetical protein
MQRGPEYVRCIRCGTLILSRTAARHQGRCTPCSGKDWYDPLQLTASFALGVLASPFVFLSFLAFITSNAAARHIPGTRANFLARLEGGWTPDWPAIRRLWSRAKAVNDGPVGAGAVLTPEYLAFKQVWMHPATVTGSELRQAIGTSTTLLDAYCILALDYRDERELLMDLPREITESKRRFRVRHGCFGVEQSLGEFLAFHASAPESRPRWPDDRI